ADRNRSHRSTSKTPSYTKSVSWQHHRLCVLQKKASGRSYHSDNSGSGGGSSGGGFSGGGGSSGGGGASGRW
ncbi:hypothetical protein P1U22_20100, partial [Escherichia coli]|nr:hypothetical protein [Escherichia coli]